MVSSFVRPLLSALGLLLAVLPVMSAEAVLYKGYEVLPEAFIYRYPISRSQWLWNQEPKVARHAESFFRLKLHLDEPVKRASLEVKYDDYGQLYVNGHECREEDLGKKLQRGDNVLAFRLKNNLGPGGILFYGEVETKSGHLIPIHSHPDAVKASPRPEPGWQTPTFIDSSWQPARSQGDVTATPWSSYGTYTERFTSPEEKVAMRTQKAAALALPPHLKLETEPEPQARILYEGGLPLIEVNGEKMLPIIHIHDMRGTSDVFQDNMVLKQRKQGIRIFDVRMTDHNFYKGPGNYDFSAYDEEARRLLHLVPDARFLVSFTTGNMVEWLKEHPDEQIEYAAGPVDECNNPAVEYEIFGRPRHPSAASQLYREEVLRELRALADYVKSRPWSKRVIGFRLNYGIYMEWHTYGMYQSPDTGKRMTERFRDYLRKKYRTETALRQAWADQTASFDTARVPPVTARRQPGGLLLDPTKKRPALDYFDCHSQVQADFLLAMAREIKLKLPGRLCGGYYGYVFTSCSPEGSNVLLDRVLSSPYVDFLCNPIDYTALTRQAGGDGGHRTVPATFHRYGKLAVLEDDTRFHQPYVRRAYAMRTPRESRVVACRNICNMVFDGTGIQFLDPEGGIGNRPHFFDDAHVQTGLKQGLAALRKLQGRVGPTSGNDTVVVVNYLEKLRHDNGAHRQPLYFQLYRQTKQHLYRSGIGFDLMTLQDFLLTDQDYKVMVFLNLFSPSQQEREAILKKTRRAGRSAVWLVAPGAVTDRGFSDQSMTDLTGIELRGADFRARVASRDPQANSPAKDLYAKRLPDGSRAFFVAKPPTSGTQWQQILRLAGAHVFARPENYFRKHGNLFLFHTAQAGQYPLSIQGQDGKIQDVLTGKHYDPSNLLLSTDGPDIWLLEQMP